MKLHNVNKMPDSFKEDYVLSNLSEQDFKNSECDQRIFKTITDIYYWYAEGSSCGAGHILAKDKNDLWYHHDCGHCSCYGPVEKLDFSSVGMPFKKLLDSFSLGLLKEIKPITDKIKKDSKNGTSNKNSIS